jgi:protein O-GlcNAc transferase
MNDALLRDARRARELGDLSQAARLYAQVVRADATNFDALLALGMLNHDSGNYEDARRLITEAVRLNGSFAPAYFALGCTLQALGRNREALSAFEQALSRDSQHEQARLCRANMLLALKAYREAVEAYDLFLKNNRQSAEAWHNRGVALSELKRFGDAVGSFDQALALAPDSADSWHNRGLVHSELNDFEAAVRDHEHALAIAPDLADARGHLVFAKLTACDWRGLDDQRAAVSASIRAGMPAIVPFANLMISESPADQMQCAQIWMARHAAVTRPLWRGERYEHERIRVAYVSGDFRVHPVAILMAGVFEHHDRQHFEISGISFGPDDGSDVRARVAGAFEHFIDVRGRSDFEIATMLREMQIDILVDLMGPTADCRVGIFAARPAPVQVNYLGYPGTMACSFMDYILADAIVIPESEKRHYSEKIVYLPDSCMACDDKRAIAVRKPTRAELGLPPDGFVFCSFNHTHKFAPEMFAVWMRILRGVEGSVLWLPQGNEPARRNLSREAQAHGVAPERLVFAPFVAAAEDHLARLASSDLFLGTLPCNAHATASDALWAGLPILTCKGSTFAGRIAASLLCAIGLPELVTQSLEDYEALAVSLAQDRAALAALKDKLARNRNAELLFDTAKFTRGLEAAYTHMRERSLRGEAPQGFAVDEGGAP